MVQPLNGTSDFSRRSAQASDGIVGGAAGRVKKRLRERRLGAPPAAAKSVDRRWRAVERRVGLLRACARRAARRPDRRASGRGPGTAVSASLERSRRSVVIAARSRANPAPSQAFMTNSARVELLGPERALPGELRFRFRHVALREPHETEQPVQAARRIALPEVGLAVLDDRPFAQHRLGAIERAAGDVDHRGFEMREREIGIQVGHPRQGAQALISPGGMRHPEVMRPLTRLERDRAPRRRRAPRSRVRR